MLDVLWRQSILHAAEITIDQIKGRGNILVDIVLENSIMGAREGRNGNWVFLAEASECIVMHWKEERIEGETLYRMISGQLVLSTLISGHIFYPLWKFLLSLGRSSRVRMRKPKDFTGSRGGGLAGESCSLGAEQPPSLPNSLWPDFHLSSPLGIVDCTLEISLQSLCL